jgi:diphthamide biosynthesis protein 2
MLPEGGGPVATIPNPAPPSSTASYLAGRSWQGLERKLGETAVTKAVEGRRGIAIAYEGEGKSS